MYLILRIYINGKNCIQKIFLAKKNVGIYFSIVHISLNFALRDVKPRVAVDDIHLEGILSQNLDLCQKTGNFSHFF